MTVVTRVNLLGALNKTLNSMIKRNVYVGIPGDARKTKRTKKVVTKNGKRVKVKDSSPKINNAYLGFIHEKGSPKQGIPARPFLEPGVKQAGKDVSKILGSSVLSLTKDEVEINLNKAGLVAVQSVKNRIRNSVDMRGLEESTIDHKLEGANKPLIETGQLINSITYVIKDD